MEVKSCLRLSGPARRNCLCDPSGLCKWKISQKPLLPWQVLTQSFVVCQKLFSKLSWCVNIEKYSWEGASKKKQNDAFTVSPVRFKVVKTHMMNWSLQSEKYLKRPKESLFLRECGPWLQVGASGGLPTKVQDPQWNLNCRQMMYYF